MIFNMVKPEITLVANYEDLCKRVTQQILVLSNQKIAQEDRFTIALAGGSTPKGVYECMASSSYRDQFKWEKIHLFWGDERYVPHEDQRSNYHMVSQALLSKIKTPPENVHAVQTDVPDAQRSASLYETGISDLFKLKKNEFPTFDLILLGLGQDGHTASLFPGNPSLLVKDRLVIATSQKGIPEERISFTFPTINHADSIYFVVSGPDKAGIVAEILEDKNKAKYPAQEVDPVQGRTHWFLDEAAASKLVPTTGTRSHSEN